LLIGNDLQKVVDSRRSHLEHWFTFRQDGANITVDDPEVKAERRKEIYEGASVYIEQNPSLWRDMPPGADEFLKTLNVSRS
jgi:ribosome recycling factor